MSRISIRVTLIPQGFVASSTLIRSSVFMRSLLLSISSNSIDPSTARMLVMTRFCIANVLSFTS